MKKEMPIKEKLAHGEWQSFSNLAEAAEKSGLGLRRGAEKGNKVINQDVFVDKTGKGILKISIVLAGLITLVSSIGIGTKEFYSQESLNWQVQSVGQDMIDLLLIVPVLLVAALFALRKKYAAYLVWAGTVLYIVYSFTIYCFAVHFNKLFIFYCIILGLSVYSLVWFFYSQLKNLLTTKIPDKKVSRVTGVYFITIASVFYFIWLSEIIPAAIERSLPASLREIGLLTNPVHVIDLSVFLPGVFIAGFIILRRKVWGFALGVMGLSFFVLMDITIGWLAMEMKNKGLVSGWGVIITMIILAFVSLGLLIWNLSASEKRTYAQFEQ